MRTQTEPEDDQLQAGLSAVLSERRQLINLAYRFLGSLADAEDVVQEAYARWYAMAPAQREAVTSPGGWLTTVASRICLDLLGSARARRERYVGEWIPEPLPAHSEWAGARTGTAADPADRITLDESVNMAFLVVLDSMTPAERVAFILHDVFRYSFAEVAESVGRSPAACRQLASSARRRIRSAQQAPATATAQRADIVRNFKQAWEAKDIAALIGLLDPDATGLADGGGLVNAAPPTGGGDQIARYLVTITGKVPGLRILERTVNGEPGLIVQQDGVTVSVLAFDFAGERIKHLWAVRNPEKLRPWTTG
ncbi:RNA polymerase sigma factor SigJ [Streptomyces sp. NPDC046465]|uniref:RNA polymerase sigma factor SigJ n=1 Tax=Streptomyces sp. NPDC046465 TaxID=3155810 RepID=UPI00341092D2